VRVRARLLVAETGEIEHSRSTVGHASAKGAIKSKCARFATPS
jgi:hypothetical protein